MALKNESIATNYEKVHPMNPTMRRTPGILAVLLFTATAPVAGQTKAPAASYPERSIRLVVPLAPGGNSDLIARLLGQKLADRLGQPVVIDNRPGAGGVIGTDLVAKAQPDGHTLLMGFFAPLSVSPAMTRVPYDTLKDFSPITRIASAQYILVVHPSVQAKSVKDLVARAKAQSRPLNYASAGNGTPGHLSAELFKLMSGVDLLHVPYKGGGPAGTAVLAGEAQVFFGSVPASMPHVNAGKLIALAVTGSTRSRVAPALPTMVEAGYPGFEVTSWYGLLAPARTPRAVVAKLNAEAKGALAALDEQLATQGVDVATSTPEELHKFMKQEMDKWSKVVKAAGIRAD